VVRAERLLGGLEGWQGRRRTQDVAAHIVPMLARTEAATSSSVCSAKLTNTPLKKLAPHPL